MKKKITESQLRSIVEQKVDEAWYNNIDDFYHGVGKAATIGALGASSLMGGAYCLDKGLENQERYEQSLNQEAQKNSIGTEPHYQKWCEEHGLNPDDNNTLNQYNEWFEDMNESKIRSMVRRAIVEQLVRRELKKQLKEEMQYSNGIERDSEGLLNGVTSCSGYEHCGQDLMFVVNRDGNIEDPSCIVYVTRNDGGYEKYKKIKEMFPFDKGFIIWNGTIEEYNGNKEVCFYWS